ncbi:LacI family DNA-binding transcriptional regulator [Sphingobacterium sp. 1.A.4]|uniref:LacI family DNA-binding transcriptional regulator n=1 Tax=Sphingobacterium sp. 1.A.4 TaxID=2044603 RepID=UPI000C0BFA27|nr:LacI family DNA-binding transcriptional regulator [Sphingobacterium sp. 1.A.4]
MKQADSPRITIKDIAKALNVSTSTVSRVLSNHPAISEATKKMVNEKVKELGFSIDPIASSFRSKKTKSIGVICPRIDIDFHSKVISGIEDYAYKNGYQITIFQSQDNYKKEKEIVQMLESSLAAGLIICPGLETHRYEHLKKLKKANIPLVVYDRNATGLKTNKVMINDHEASFKATEHLIQIGCKQVAHISGDQSVGIFQSRLQGYKDALLQQGLTVQEELIKEAKHLSYEEGLELAQSLANSNMKIDGLVCANDYTAAAAIQVFKKLGFQIPKDIAIIGFSNYPISKVVDPQLSSIDDNAYSMGKVASKLLIQQIEDPDFEHTDYQEILIKTELILRESSDRDKY